MVNEIMRGVDNSQYGKVLHLLGASPRAATPGMGVDPQPLKPQKLQKLNKSHRRHRSHRSRRSRRSLRSHQRFGSSNKSVAFLSFFLSFFVSLAIKFPPSGGGGGRFGGTSPYIKCGQWFEEGPAGFPCRRPLKPCTARTRPPPTPYPSTRISGGIKSPRRASLVNAGPACPLGRVRGAFKPAIRSP
eukprot:3199401-Prymnesium_polylepis.1